MALLDNINNPDDLKKLSREELPILAQEVRDLIIDVVSKNGGHLASNLGVVELTIALHYIFDTKRDKVVWDVGHQAYTHKILTGRRDLFHTLRQYGGISGFPRQEESPFDVFNVGHSGTSISAALGMVEARDRRGEDYKIIAVIGDGSMTAGMAFEGLNQAGHLKKNFIVILNDNEMSITKNVGALSSYLSRIVTGKFYTKVKDETKTILKTIPGIGEPMLRAVMRTKESVKGLIVPGVLFEELGFEYIGPIDGHRFEALIPTLDNIQRLKGSFLVHVVTKKGKGYSPAENNPARFHGVSPFDKATGELKPKGSIPSYTEVFGRTLVKLAKKDKRIIGICAAMPEGTGLDEFSKEFPDRFYDVGIAEQHAVTFAAGLAVGGYRPVVAIYSTFLQRAYDQIAHDVCLQNLPVTFILDRGGIVGEDGPTHHGLFDIAYLRHLPNMVIMAPKDQDELQHMLYTSLTYNGPVAIRYPRGEGVGVSLEAYLKPIEIGKGEIIINGTDAFILAFGNTVVPALQASKMMIAEGISVGVANARFAKPLDRELISNIANRVEKLITVEEHVLAGGFGSAVLEFLTEEGFFSVQQGGKGIEVKRLGIPDKYIEHGYPKILRRKYNLDTEGIVMVIKELLTATPKSVNGRLEYPSLRDNNVTCLQESNTKK